MRGNPRRTDALSPPTPRPGRSGISATSGMLRGAARRGGGKPAPEDRAGVAAVDRAFAILDAFSEPDRSLSLAELARRTGYYKSTILRLIESIARAGYLEQLEDGTYAIGPKALHLGRLHQTSFPLDRILRPALLELSIATGETASFFVRDGDHRLCLRRVEPERSVRIVLREGDRLPLHLGAAGQILAAFGDRPPSSLAAIRRAMVAVTRGERDPDAGSVAVPVFAANARLVGALSVSGPIGRFDAASVRAFARRLLRAAAILTEAGGGDPLGLRAACDRIGAGGLAARRRA